MAKILIVDDAAKIRFCLMFIKIHYWHVCRWRDAAVTRY